MRRVLLTLLAVLGVYVVSVLLYDRTKNPETSISDQLTHFRRIVVLDFDRSSNLRRMPLPEREKRVLEFMKTHESVMEATFESGHLVVVIKSKDDAENVTYFTKVLAEESQIVEKLTLLFSSETLAVSHF